MFLVLYYESANGKISYITLAEDDAAEGVESKVDGIKVEDNKVADARVNCVKKRIRNEENTYGNVKSVYVVTFSQVINNLQLTGVRKTPQEAWEIQLN